MKKEFLVAVRASDETYLKYMSHEEVEKCLNDDWTMPSPYTVVTEDQMSKGLTLEYFPAYHVLIFKGKFCQVDAVEKVVEWRLK